MAASAFTRQQFQANADVFLLNRTSFACSLALAAAKGGGALKKEEVEMKRIIVFLLAATYVLVVLSVNWVHAAGGSSLSVSKTATVAGTVVSGVITITNTSKTKVTIATIDDTLEVRFPSDVQPLPLVPSATAGWFLVTTVSLPKPAPIASGGKVMIPYSINVCDSTVERYPGAKDMRNVVVVTTAASGTRAARSFLARSPNFPLPLQNMCPVCGNGIIEGAELCDGGACCLATCQPVTNGTACSDGNACTRMDTCQAGVCSGSNPVTCTASDQCHTAGTCSPATGTCSNPAKANGTSCNDGNACSTGDACTNGQCMGAPMACNDGNACTTDSCSGGACVFNPNTNPCNDGNGCTVGDTCSGGSCLGGAPRDCNDNQACTADACDPTVGACTHTTTPECGTCDAGGCTTCQTACTASREQCMQGCLDGFFSCLNGCTSTYCAPFCQVDYGACLNACPVEATCKSVCETGNGCAAGCTQP